MFRHRRGASRLRRVAGALTAFACAAAALAAAAAPVAATTETAAIPETVATGPTQSLGEPAAAGDAAVSAIAATKFDTPPPPAGTLVGVWARRAGSATWTPAGIVLPAGFGYSYDPSAAASPGGPLLVVAGAAPGGKCITNGSVAIANVDSRGRLGAARLVSDQRGTDSFDDRPVVAVGQDGTVWVAWSQGQNSDACQNVGPSDRLEVAVSHDGGQTFGAPVTMPADGGGSAFGARLAPLPGGGVAVSWTETMGGSGQAVLVSVLGPGGQLTGPWPVLTGDGPPLTLPGASFYDFPAGDIVALPGNRLMVAAPFWQSGHSVIKLAVGAPGGQWQASVVPPPGGADLLLPALGLLSAGDVRLLCAVHSRSDDAVGYDWADVRVSGQGDAVSAGLTSLTPAPAGQGFWEIGEELSLAPTPGGLLTSFVVAGSKSAALQTATFTAPLPIVAPSAKATSAASRPTAHTALPASGTAGSGGGQRYVTAALTAGGVLFCAVLALGGWWVSRRQANRRGRHSVDRRAGPSADWRGQPPADRRPGPPPDWRAQPPPDWRPGPPPDWRPGPPPDRRPGPPPDWRPGPPADRRPGPPPPDWRAQPPANRPGR
jgi:hypothetical protein